MSERKIYRLSDSLIGQIRDLIQLAILTRTNIIDHFRILRLEASPDPGKDSDLVLTPEYVEYYNNTIKKLAEEVENFVSGESEKETGEEKVSN